MNKGFRNDALRITKCNVVSIFIVICVLILACTTKRSQGILRWDHLTSPSRCSNFYIDLGTNNAESIVDFISGSGPSVHKEVRPVVDYRTNNGMDISEFCVFGFEPNPAHSAAHRKVEAEHGKKVQHLEIFSKTAAGPVDGSTTLAVDPYVGKFPSWGSSVMKDYSGMRRTNETVRVRTMDLQKFFIERVLRNLAPDGKVLVRMDVEGAEFVLLRDLVASGMACRHFDMLLVEWHHTKFPESALCQKAMIEWMLSSPKCKPGWKRQSAPESCDGWKLSDQFSS